MQQVTRDPGQRAWTGFRREEDLERVIRLEGWQDLEGTYGLSDPDDEHGGMVSTKIADFDSLSADQQAALLTVVAQFVTDLKAGAFRSNLRVKGVKGAAGIFEMTWAADGRATFEYGNEITPGETHIIWRRVGSHEVSRAP